MESKRIKKISLIGKLNVGKRTLLNYFVYNKKQKLWDLSILKSGIRNDSIQKSSDVHVKLVKFLIYDITLNPINFSNKSDVLISKIILSDLIYILVDITEGIQKETRDVLRYLMQHKKKFGIILNKIDKIQGWVNLKISKFEKSFNNQNKFAKFEFKRLTDKILIECTSLSINTKLHYIINENGSDESISIIPISAKSGEGVIDLIPITQNYFRKH